MSVENLINSLRAIDAHGGTMPKDNQNILAASHSTVQHVAQMACSWLMEPNGECDWGSIDRLQDAGYSVYCWKADRFGYWMVGAIETQHGIILYGE